MLCLVKLHKKAGDMMVILGVILSVIMCVLLYKFYAFKKYEKETGYNHMPMLKSHYVGKLAMILGDYFHLYNLSNKLYEKSNEYFMECNFPEHIMDMIRKDPDLNSMVDVYKDYKEKEKMR